MKQTLITLISLVIVVASVIVANAEEKRNLKIIPNSYPVIQSSNVEFLHNFGNISGDYKITGDYTCMDDTLSVFKDQYNHEIQIAYKTTTNIYDVYYIFKNDKHKGYVYVGPNKDSRKVFYSYREEWGYLIIKKRKKDDKIKIIKSVDSTITDGWKDKMTTEYSCEVKITGKMLEQVNYVVVD